MQVETSATAPLTVDEVEKNQLQKCVSLAPPYLCCDAWQTHPRRETE